MAVENRSMKELLNGRSYALAEEFDSRIPSDAIVFTFSTCPPIRYCTIPENLGKALGKLIIDHWNDYHFVTLEDKGSNI
jgi:hypothetical protein